MRATVIGGGPAGSEAAWQLAERGVEVELWEMRPDEMTPAHRTGFLGELVCSNSLRGAALETGPGLLKEEMRLLGSLVMICADAHRVPAGDALAVDREGFSRSLTQRITSHPRIRLRRERVNRLPEGPGVVATGPLTHPGLAQAIRSFTGQEHLHFFDAAAPIVTAESINEERVFRASRYGKGEAVYINCPMNEEEYGVFYEQLVGAQRHVPHDFEVDMVFEGCMPVEVMAARGYDTLRYGPLKPVGLIDPRTGQRPYAVVQLRPENSEATMYNLVGFQTALAWNEQKRVFRLIPGLERAEFIRLGVMHKNTFIVSPRVLEATLASRKRPDLYFAGQLIGVEGYVESAATGLIAGANLARQLNGLEAEAPPRETAHGALCRYVTEADPELFQPMNINFGLLPPLPQPIRNKREKKRAMAARALEAAAGFARRWAEI